MAQQLASNPPAGTNGIPVLPGVSQALFLEYVERHRVLSQQVSEASQDRKDFLGKVKTEFGKPGYRAFLAALKAAEQPGEDREIQHLSFRRMMEWLNKPLGFQEDMFSAPEKSNVVPLDVGQIKLVDAEGEAAGRGGKRRESNPWTPSTEQYERWDTAWLRGQSQIAATLKPDDDGEPKRRGRPPGSRNKPKGLSEQTALDAAEEARDRGLVENEETHDRVH